MLSVAFYLSTSSEDEEVVIIQEINAVKKQLRQQTNNFKLPNKKLNKDSFKYVLNKISHKMQDPKRNTAVSKLIKLTATIRILAEGSYQKGAGNDHYVNLCQTTVSESFNECIEAMYSELCPRWITFEVDEAKQNEIKRHFYCKTGFPDVIGCIDGTHVSSIPPVVDRFKYFNRKGFHSLNVMLVSDAGYPLEPYLITPFRLAHQGSPEMERCIGVLKTDFAAYLMPGNCTIALSLLKKLQQFLLLYTTFLFILI
ncbi:putative nuclease HARBI1 [Lucilia cuprina]|nr:putative nuclease HARBI1 [Lucilia cuprina]